MSHPPQSQARALFTGVVTMASKTSAGSAKATKKLPAKEAGRAPSPHACPASHARGDCPSFCANARDRAEALP